MTCKKRSYLEPRVLVAQTAYEEDILQTSTAKFGLVVDEYDEYYYDSSDENTSDYLLEF